MPLVNTVGKVQNTCIYFMEYQNSVKQGTLGYDRFLHNYLHVILPLGVIIQ